MNAETVGTCDHCGTDVPRVHTTASCPNCGRPLSIEINRRLNNTESRQLLEARSILPNDDDPPQDAIIAPVPEQQTAGFIIRAVARIIDVVVGILIGIPSTMAAFLLLTILGAQGSFQDWARQMQELSAWAIALSLVGSTLYAAVAEWMGGATVGKLACGLRVLSEDFGPPTIRGTFIRALSFLIDGLLFGLPALHSMQQGPLQQRYGDKWGRTIVVKLREVPGSGQSPIRMVVGLSIGCGLWGVLQTYASVSQILAR